MRFGLQDIKKNIQRQNDELYLRLHFLRAGELDSAIKSLIVYHEQLLGQTRRQFSLDDAHSCISDYRLAHCLVATLRNWYSWRQHNWSEVLESMGNNVSSLLDAAGITASTHLRLALFTSVNEHYCGFLDRNNRTEALQAFGATFQLTVANLEYLLALDSDEESFLVRETTSIPSTPEVTNLYNQWVFEAALYNASSVHFVIDCNIFERGEEASPTTTSTTGIGAVIKRLCYLARRFGVYYDLSYAPSLLARTAVPQLHLTLYGPQEMTGTPQQYGQRLARLCRLLLGYNTAPRQKAQQVTGQKAQSRLHKRLLPSGAIVKAEATIHFLQRAYSFVMDADLLNLLPSPTEIHAVLGQGEKKTYESSISDTASIFDSSIELTFAEAFSALQSSHGVDGWSLVREPEPLLLEDSIFIPDFALTRAQQRIYVEILGYWTPGYRERKMQKLQQLSGRNDIILAIPIEAREPFASIADTFPIVWYEGSFSAVELLTLLRTRYNDFAERLALINREEVQRRVANVGLLPERLCYELLHCYRRTELLHAAEHVIGEGIAYKAGLGLYHEQWMKQQRASFVDWLGQRGAASLLDILQETRQRWPDLASCEDATLEALLGLWPELNIRRSSIFDAIVEVIDQATTSKADLEAQQPFLYTAAEPEEQLHHPSKKQVREKRAPQKKRPNPDTAQGALWE